MSKIFEALQVAQRERRQVDKLARQLSTEPKDNAPVLEPTPVPEVRTKTAERAACDCEQQSHRLRRRGLWDSLLGLFGFYPWKCSQCHRHFHRSRRY
jgi:hypothetical protein